jgi:aminoacyl tRNA synthase complex-interacting multifunctional protein 1
LAVRCTSSSQLSTPLRDPCVDYSTGGITHCVPIHYTTMASALDLIDQAISDLEARLSLAPGGGAGAGGDKKDKKAKKQKGGKTIDDTTASTTNNADRAGSSADDQPDICKLEFKVGQIVKVWEHPEADKLYCEEIDVGEAGGPRQIASGLRPHFSLDEMMGQRLLVVSNLKPKNLVKFKSHGMVLCAAQTLDDGSEKVEFIEPPLEAKIGEVVSFEGLPPPMPVAAAQVEKKKIFMACLDGLKTTSEGLAAWNGHVFTTSAGPCKAKTIKEGVMR